MCEYDSPLVHELFPVLLRGGFEHPLHFVHLGITATVTSMGALGLTDECWPPLDRVSIMLVEMSCITKTFFFRVDVCQDGSVLFAGKLAEPQIFELVHARALNDSHHRRLATKPKLSVLAQRATLIERLPTRWIVHRVFIGAHVLSAFVTPPLVQLLNLLRRDEDRHQVAATDPHAAVRQSVRRVMSSCLSPVLSLLGASLNELFLDSANGVSKTDLHEMVFARILRG
mmetsp:Transcript_46789/g.124221  ORF Transcript_46789/g.124221 Transcript_46789/m.124221 type:complete len:228 (+) Transcript_46789:419-1102(+)